MMYHFMFGFSLAAGEGWTSAPPSGCSPLVPLMFSSAITFKTFRRLSRSARQQPVHAVCHSIVDDPEIKGENGHGNDHHHGGGSDFLPAGKSHLPHFIADIGKETPGAGGHRSKFAAYTAIVVIKRCCYLSHSTPLN